MSLEKLVVPDDNTFFQMEGLSESKQTRVTHELIRGLNAFCCPWRLQALDVKL
jgi:hypothetical protein